MSSLELKVPPPAVALFLGVLMRLASSLVAPVDVALSTRVAVALVLVSLGLGIGVSGMVSFRRAKTTMNPTKPAATSSLVMAARFVLHAIPCTSVSCCTCLRGLCTCQTR